MTRKQRIILTVGLAVFVVSAIFPPWRDYSGKFGPYALLTHAGDERLDIHRLLVEWIIIVAVAGGLMLLTTKGKSE